MTATETPAAPALEGEASAKRVFELFVDTLLVERDAADDALLVRLRWYGEDVTTAAARLRDDPRAARALIEHLAAFVDELQRGAAGAEVMEENLHQARRWALLLPEVVAPEPPAEVADHTSEAS